MPTPRDSRRFTDEQMSNARVIISVGRSLGASQRDILIALMTGFQESGLRSLNYGDRDSIGIFQQRNAWGSRAARLDPTQSARMFFTGGSQGQRGLLDFKQRDQWSLTQAAQKVQVSAFPNAYAKHEGKSRDLLSELSGATIGPPGEKPSSVPATPDSSLLPSTGESNALADLGEQLSATSMQNDGMPAGVSAATAPGIESADEMPQFDMAMDFLPAAAPEGADPESTQTFSQAFPKNGVVNGSRDRAIQFAKGLLGTPYIFGGNDPDVGLDCSSFTQLVLKQVGVNLPRVSFQQANGGAFGKRTSLSGIKAGDLVAWDNSSRNRGADHIALYLADGMIIEEPRPGLGVRIRRLGDNEGAWGVALNY